MHLGPCKYCGQLRSDTALYCPACRKVDDAAINWATSAKTATRAVALFGLALIGPNAVVGAILGPEMNRPTGKTIRKIAGRIGAIDSVPAGLECTVFFTQTGFVRMHLYDLKRNPEIPDEIPYSSFVGIETMPVNADGEISGTIEFLTPRNLKPPRRPRSIERFMLGADLYRQLTEAAEEFEKNGPSPTVCFPFLFSGSHAKAFAQLLCDKFAEYAGRPADVGASL